VNVVDARTEVKTLGEDPLMEAAMSEARFEPDPTANQPGAWMSPCGIPVDLMVPEACSRSRRLLPLSERIVQR
jgi:hypothetical protein